MELPRFRHGSECEILRINQRMGCTQKECLSQCYRIYFKTLSAIYNTVTSGTCMNLLCKYMHCIYVLCVITLNYIHWKHQLTSIFVICFPVHLINPFMHSVIIPQLFSCIFLCCDILVVHHPAQWTLMHHPIYCKFIPHLELYRSR